MNSDCNYLLKLLIIGDSGCGKSALMNRFSENSFKQEYHSTIGIDFNIKKININNEIIKAQIWDTAGQERFRSITNAYYKHVNAVMIVYNISDTESFNNIVYWIKEYKKNVPENTPVILIGNQCDLQNERQITFKNAKDLADSFNITYQECSAKTGWNVEESFMYLINEWYSKQATTKTQNQINHVNITNIKSKNKCCN
jgi:Ras-related protein Rab-1A